MILANGRRDWCLSSSFLLLSLLFFCLDLESGVGSKSEVRRVFLVFYSHVRINFSSIEKKKDC